MNWFLEKAERDLDALRQEPNPDTIYNFFVTARAAVDKGRESIPKEAWNALWLLPEIKACARIANMGKHSIRGEMTGDGGEVGPSHADVAFHGGHMVYTIRFDDRDIEVVSLADRLLFEIRRVFEHYDVQ